MSSPNLCHGRIIISIHSSDSCRIIPAKARVARISPTQDAKGVLRGIIVEEIARLEIGQGTNNDANLWRIVQLFRCWFQSSSSQNFRAYMGIPSFPLDSTSKRFVTRLSRPSTVACRDQSLLEWFTDGENGSRTMVLRFLCWLEEEKSRSRVGSLLRGICSTHMMTWS